MDERSLAQALARFEGFRKNIPPAIRENVVNEYHGIVDALATATGEDLTPFKIRPDELKHKVVAARPAPYRGGRGSTTYSSDKYCDDSRFQARVDSLAEYLESAGHRRRSGGRNEPPKIVPLTIPVFDSFVSSDDEEDRKFAQLAVEEARKSIPEDGRVHPKVGVVVVKDGRILAKAHRGEIPQGHAEYIALEKKLENVSLSGSTVYTTLEPCTARNHPKTPCANRLAERKVARVMIGMLDPDDRISGRGQRTLRKAGITTVLFPDDLMAEVEELNRDFVRDRECCAAQSINSHTINLDGRILEFLEAGVAPGDHPLTGSGDVLFRASEIAEALSVPKGALVDRLKNLETEGRVRRHEGTLDNSAPRWSIVRF